MWIKVNVRKSPRHKLRMAFIHACKHRTPCLSLGAARIPLRRLSIALLPVCLCHLLHSHRLL